MKKIGGILRNFAFTGLGVLVLTGAAPVPASAEQVTHATTSLVALPNGCWMDYQASVTAGSWGTAVMRVLSNGTLIYSTSVIPGSTKNYRGTYPNSATTITVQAYEGSALVGSTASRDRSLCK